VDSSIFFGGSFIAAVVAGMIALFAPCCISVMLPAYFAGSFQNRKLLVAMTFLFAAGIATVILPLAMGASALRQLITGQHTIVYVVGGLMMLGLGAYTLLGGHLHIPMPGRRAGGKGGPFSVYSLGVFSGVASSCCAPVLAGVIALSGSPWGSAPHTCSGWSPRSFLSRFCGRAAIGARAVCSGPGPLLMGWALYGVL